MRAAIENSRAHWRVVALALVAVGTAGCSSEVTRFDDNPFANPYAAKPRNEVTNSTYVAQPVQPAPSARIESQPLPQPYQPQPYQSPSYQPPPYQPPPYQAQPYQPLPPPPGRQSTLSPPGTYGGSTGIASYSPAPQSDITGALRPARSSWDWDGGTPVTVAPGETVDGLSRRYGVPSAAIMRANGLSPGSRLQPGQRVVIPRYNDASIVARSADHSPAPKQAIVAGGAPSMQRAIAARLSQGSSVHVVQSNETLTSIGRRYGKTVTEIAAANRIPPYTRVKMGERLTIPGGAAVAQAPRHPPPLIAPRTRPQKIVTIDQPPQVHIAQQPREESKPIAATGGTPSFAWPARGHIIAGFGEKMPSGQVNDGINLALPEGTPVRAAEDGEVVYASNELRMYGNLILIHHPNGFVTAYAHSSEILVKRGDLVKRGQVIARAGATGSVKAPQLHFETRKGSTPVDPAQYLREPG